MADDLILPFQISASALRGRMVRLDSAVDEILAGHDYPARIGKLLGEAVTLAALLAAALKYDGIFTLQTKGDGPVHLMVADITSAGDLRGYAQFDAAALAAVPADAPDVPGLLGAGYLAFTVDQGEHTERYQGMVALTGDSLVDCIQHYFRQSEQIATAIALNVSQGGKAGTGEGWRAGAIMIQRLPTGGGYQDAEAIVTEEEADDGWQRARAFLGTCSGGELVDPALPAQDLLFRLFHEDGIRVWPLQPVRAQCRCSRERITRVLLSIPADELRELEEDGKLTVTCEFCSTVYDFKGDDIAAMIDAPPAGNA